MARIEIAKVPDKKVDKRSLYASVCYYYPQYTLQDVQRMPVRDVNLLINTAKKMQALDYFNQVQIAAAPHSDKGRGVKKLSEHYRKEANG